MPIVSFMNKSIAPGLAYEFRFIVPASKTVPALYPEATEFQQLPEVFATGFMVGLMEWACMRAVHPWLDMARQMTLGTHIAVSHAAATPPGLEVTVRVKLTEVRGRRLSFEVQAHDGVDLIGAGTHERAIVDRVAFSERVAHKRAHAAGLAGALR